MVNTVQNQACYPDVEAKSSLLSRGENVSMHTRLIYAYKNITGTV